MAIIKPFSVGKTKGKLGDIIYYEVAGEIRARMVPTEVKDAKTPKQMAQRSRMKSVAEQYGMLDTQLYAYWKSLTEGTAMNAYSLFVSRNIRNIDGNGEVVDYAELCVTAGDLLVPSWVRMEEAEDGQRLVTWDASAEGWGNHATKDQLQLAVHTLRGNKGRERIKVVAETAAERKTGQYLWALPANLGKAHVYGFFRGKYFKEEVSDSFYLGMVGGD